MEKTLNPIYPSWTGDDDPNVRFLEEHILRTTIPSECDKTFSMYGCRHSQHDNAGSSTTASATNEEALWEEVIQKIDTTSKIEISSTNIDLIIKFFREEEEICQIQIPRNAFYPNVDSRQGNLTWESKRLILTTKSLNYLRCSVKKKEVQNFLSPLFKFGENEKKTNFRYFAHEDGNGVSWVDTLSGKEISCRQLLMPGKLVFVFPEEFHPLDLNKVMPEAKSGRVNISGDTSHVKMECEVYPTKGPKFDIIQFITFDKRGKPNFYRRDSIYDNVFYKINFRTLKEPSRKFLKTIMLDDPNRQPPTAALPFWRPWEDK
eukprot:GHVP01034475.1.p1 GENE.GHVP01034475.1~~GHVP01034475.1.p1  ORF type:complete len:318 (+),score=38.65 GHVP01034475.1:15-968(+)